jgi:phospholipid/cholesterol/gamma-HCH transport system ATP-binding protein
MTPRIELAGVSKRFGSRQVLDGLDVAVMPGESLVIIGGSGTGKSVMLKCILGLIPIDGGSIKVDGEEVAGLRGAALDAHRTRFGMLFQGGALFSALSVFDNVALPLRELPDDAAETDGYSRDGACGRGERRVGIVRNSGEAQRGARRSSGRRARGQVMPQSQPRQSFPKAASR